MIFSTRSSSSSCCSWCPSSSSSSCCTTSASPDQSPRSARSLRCFSLGVWCRSLLGQRPRGVLLRGLDGERLRQAQSEDRRPRVVLLTWATKFRDQGFAILGDNLSSLTRAIELQGRGKLTAITREISWRRVRLGWRYAVAHLPTEVNATADALSRLSAPEGSDIKPFPSDLKGARQIDNPDFSGVRLCA